MYNKDYRKKELKISGVEKTDATLTGRAGIAFFVTYLYNINIFPILERFFGTIRKNKKGLGVSEIFKQVFCFMVDGTSRHLTYFDYLAKDKGYAACLETAKEDMASSHQIKRFFNAFSWTRNFLFRRILQDLFIWRLNIKRPKVVYLGIDTMVMDNNDAKCREGVKPTYKKVKGFQPLQMNWGRVIVDSVFRSGNKHSNHGDTVLEMIKHIVAKIRKGYRKDVPIVIRIDRGFYDQKIFRLCEELGIGYICGGKMYKDIKEFASTFKEDAWKNFEPCGKEDKWQYIEFGSKRTTWNRYRRAFYCRLIGRGKELYLPLLRPDKVIITNIGQGQKIDELLKKAGAKDLLKPESIIACYHERGADELANRALKDFGYEQLPFKRFEPNCAWYYTMLIAHFLLECFKEDVTSPVINVASYATTFRRQFIDIAARIVSHSKKLVLKVVSACFEHLQLNKIFARCYKTVPIV